MGFRHSLIRNLALFYFDYLGFILFGCVSCILRFFFHFITTTEAVSGPTTLSKKEKGLLSPITHPIKFHFYHTRSQGNAKYWLTQDWDTKPCISQRPCQSRPPPRSWGLDESPSKPMAAKPCWRGGMDTPELTTISTTRQDLNTWLRTLNPLGLFGLGFGFFFFLDLT